LLWLTAAVAAAEAAMNLASVVVVVREVILSYLHLHSIEADLATVEVVVAEVLKDTLVVQVVVLLCNHLEVIFFQFQGVDNQLLAQVELHFAVVLAVVEEQDILSRQLVALEAVAILLVAVVVVEMLTVTLERQILEALA
jgi:hypothetical protein